MLIDGPIASVVREHMMVSFLPQFLGALPCALCRLGALAYLGVSAMFVEDSSTNHEALRVDLSQTLLESTSFLFVSLGGRQRLFL